MIDEKNNNLRLFKETPSETADAPVSFDDTCPPWKGVCQSFEAATGYGLRHTPDIDTTDDPNVLWATPVYTEGQPSGNVTVVTREHELGPDVVKPVQGFESARALADSLSEMVTELDRTYDVIRRQEAELALNVPLASSTPLDSALWATRLTRIVEDGANTIGAQAGGFYLLDDNTTSLKLRVSSGLPLDRLAMPPRCLSGSVADIEALTGHAVVLDDARALPQWHCPEDFPSAVCVPVGTPSMILGTYWVFSATKRDFSDSEINILEIIAGRLASELEREILLRESHQAGLRGPNSGRCGMNDPHLAASLDIEEMHEKNLMDSCDEDDEDSYDVISEEDEDSYDNEDMYDVVSEQDISRAAEHIAARPNGPEELLSMIEELRAIEDLDGEEQEQALEDFISAGVTDYDESEMALDSYGVFDNWANEIVDKNSDEATIPIETFQGNPTPASMELPAGFENWDVAAGSVSTKGPGGAVIHWSVRPDGKLALSSGMTRTEPIDPRMTHLAFEGAVRSHGYHESRADSVISKVNNTLWTLSGGEQRGSLFHANIQPATGRMDYSCAGRIQAFIIRPHGIDLLTEATRALGDDPDARYEQYFDALADGDTLIVMNAADTGSDDPSLGLLNIKAITRAIKHGSQSTAREIIEKIQQRLPEGAADETSLFVIRRK